MARGEDKDRQHDAIFHSLKFKRLLNIQIQFVYFNLFHFVVLLVVLS